MLSCFLKTQSGAQKAGSPDTTLIRQAIEKASEDFILSGR
jgi:hypothetical protein